MQWLGEKEIEKHTKTQTESVLNLWIQTVGHEGKALPAYI